METYSYEIVSALESKVPLSRVVLPGNKNGYPPSLLQIIWFICRTTLYIFRNRKEFDIYHFSDMVLFPLAWTAKKCSSGSRVVMTVYGLDLLYGNRVGVKPAIYRKFLSWAAKQNCVDHFISISSNTTDICRAAGFKPVDCVSLGVRSQSLLEPQETRERYLLFVGRLVTRKGAGWFAKNVLDLLPDDLMLFVVGKPWDQSEIEILQNNKRVRLLGFLPDPELDELKRQCVAMLMPNIPSTGNTDVEGFGLVALEAGSQGIPLIVADIEGLSDAVRHGETGFLITSGDAEAWALQIDSLLSWSIEDRNKFGRDAKAAVQKYYSWDRVAEETLDIYRMD